MQRAAVQADAVDRHPLVDQALAELVEQLLRLGDAAAMLEQPAGDGPAGAAGGRKNAVIHRWPR